MYFFSKWGKLYFLTSPIKALLESILNYYPLGGGNGNPLKYSCLENPMDEGACWAIA